jgi:hypothetical protein
VEPREEEEAKGKRPLRGPMHIWEDNIKTDLTETGKDVVDWTNPTQDRGQWRGIVTTIMNLRGQFKSGNFLTS